MRTSRLTGRLLAPVIALGLGCLLGLTSGPLPATPPQPAPTEKPLSEADLICVVGDQHILAGDVLVFVEPIMEENSKNIPISQQEQFRRQLVRQYLTKYVELKALYLEFFREGAGKSSPEEMKESRQKILSTANKMFYEKQIPDLLKKNKVADLKELEEKLRAKRMSVTLLRKQFVESVLALQAERRHVPEDVEIGREELLAYYAKHAEDWHKPGRAQWRQLTARFDRFADKAAARFAIEAMGNEIFLGGKPFEAVAKEKSQSISAENGGLHDWTTQGSLKSKQLDQAIFSIPTGLLSQVIEDEVGFHIIEVIEREDAHTVTFEEAQLEMREKLADAKKAELREAFHKKVMERTVVWTRWPEDIPGSRSLAEVMTE